MRTRAGLLLGLPWILAACMASTAPVPTVRLDPLRVPPPGSGALAPVAFLAGCWRGPAGSGTTILEERWTPPEGGVMLATSRFIRDDRVVSFEFGIIRAEDGAVVYLPHPGGKASDHAFRLTESAPDEATFEAPEHDYPRRILYRRTPEGLTARIDGGVDDPEPRSWTLAAVACHGRDVSGAVSPP